MSDGRRAYYDELEYEELKELKENIIKKIKKYDNFKLKNILSFFKTL